MTRAAALCLLVLVFLAMDIPGQCAPKPGEWWTSKSDQYIWEWFPDLTIRGIEHETWGCPICGTKVFRIGKA